MNKVKKDLVMQDLIRPLSFGEKEQQHPYTKQRKSNGGGSPHLRKSQEFHGLRPWKKK